MTDIATLESFAASCRLGMERAAAAPGASMPDFPKGCCGDAANLVGRLAHEVLGLDGVYVCGWHHPEFSGSHAWFEVSGHIIDVTHDQVPNRPHQWLFPINDRWYSQFRTRNRYEGFSTNFRPYPGDAYRAAHAACTPARDQAR